MVAKSVPNSPVRASRSDAEEASLPPARDRALVPPSRVKVLAFFLPQYHPIPENDEWWGKGFTDWTNVTQAKPCFTDHTQPLLPSELGFYDLRRPEIRARQTELARDYGIHGFCYYYYWFHGKKLLERPLEDMLQSGEPDFPFCICWANENWTRRWDGEDQSILIAQEHSPESDAAFIDDVMPALSDPRYIRKDGKPVLLVYRADLLSDPLATTTLWRRAAHRAGLPGLHLCAVWRVEDPLTLGFDALVEFPPHHFHHQTITDDVDGTADDFEGTIFDYRAGVEAVEPCSDEEFPLYRGVMPGWDNTARRKKHPRIFKGSSPELYGKWLEKVVRESWLRPGNDDQLVFINAWNEWAEGAVLEPSKAHGRGYLEATRSALCKVIEYQGRSDEQDHYLSNQLAHALSVLETMGHTTLRYRQDVDSQLQWLVETVNAQRTAMNSQFLTIQHSLVDLRRQLLPVTRQLWLSPLHGIVGFCLKSPLWLLSGRFRRRWRQWQEARRVLRSGLFDPGYYRLRYPEVAASGIDPLYHYIRFGAREGRDPNPIFDGRKYLEDHPEIVASGENPLLHSLAASGGHDILSFS